MLLNTVTGNAGLIAAAFAEKLLGRQVITQEWGLFEGGLCTVIALTPDANAPEIVCQVQHNTTGEEMGIFADEVLSLIEPNSHAAFVDAAQVLQLSRGKLAGRDDLIERMGQQNDQLLAVAQEATELANKRLDELEQRFGGIDIAKHANNPAFMPLLASVSNLLETAHGTTFGTHGSRLKRLKTANAASQVKQAVDMICRGEA